LLGRGISSLTIYIIATDNDALVLVLYDLSIGFTVTFNIVLTFLISARLILARRAMSVMGVHIKGLESRYITTINIVVESAAIWVSAAILYVACYNSSGSRTHNPNDPSDFSVLLPVFRSLFGITSASLSFSDNC
jgi:hypothetical protein